MADAPSPSSPESTPASTVSTTTIALLVLATALVVLYSVFVAAAPLAGLGIALPIVALYLFWRLVRAHERLAAAMESGTDRAPSTGSE